jgi:hypothetical protein
MDKQGSESRDVNRWDDVADQDEGEHSSEGSAQWSRRKFLYGIGAAGLGVLAGKVLVPSSISKAVASDLDVTNRLRFAAAQSPEYQAAVAALASKGYAFDLMMATPEPCPYDRHTYALFVPATGVAAQVGGSHITVSLFLWPDTGQVRINAIESVEAIITGEDFEAIFVIARPDLKTVSKYTRHYNPSMAALLEGPPKAPYDNLPPTSITLPTKTACEDDRYEEPVPGSQWEYDGCRKTIWCACPGPHQCDNQQWGEFCAQQWLSRQYWTCTERRSCQIDCENVHSHYRVYPSYEESCIDKGCYCGG